MLTDLKPMEHFSELVSSALSHQHVTASKDAEFYLSNLLTDFMDPVRLGGDEPLALRFLKALETGATEKYTVLRSLGDSSLFLTGFFPESLNDCTVDVEYYMGIGSSAYGQLSAHTRGATSPLFRELSVKFEPLVDVLSEVSVKSHLSNSTDILRLYEAWLRTKSEHAEAVLRDHGIDTEGTDGQIH